MEVLSILRGSMCISMGWSDWCIQRECIGAMLGFVMSEQTEFQLDQLPFTSDPAPLADSMETFLGLCGVVAASYSS